MPDSTSLSFSSLTLKPELLANLDRHGFTTMTPVQAQSLPESLAGRDVIAKANTGSGKTLAFALAVLNKIRIKSYCTQALILCPTRELADQVAKDIRRTAQQLANLKVSTFTGGVPIGPQLQSLNKPPHIAVGTPGRVKDLLRKRALNLFNVDSLVLDEADRMLDMGFEDDIKDIIGILPQDRQTLLFSATYPDEIEHISRSLQQSPVNIEVASSEISPQIAEEYFLVKHSERIQALGTILQQHKPNNCIVFCNTKIDCEKVALELRQHRVSALSLQGDMEQKDRDQVYVQFGNGSARVLVATDVAARGLDIKELDAVINYELPHQPDTYVHRIGRTGRAGEEGQAFNLVTEREINRAQDIEEFTGRDSEWFEIGKSANWSDIPNADMTTLMIDAGRKDKIRPGDILGALTSSGGIQGSRIGKIDIFHKFSYVAIEKPYARQALNYLQSKAIKARKFRSRLI